MSSSSDAPGTRPLRIAGVVLLLVVQGGCAVSLRMVESLHRLDRAMRPSRAAHHADLARREAPPPMFPAITGYVERIDDGSIEVMTVVTRRRVRVDAYTSLFTPTGRASAGDLRPGVVASIAGDEEPSGELVADVVVVRPPS